MRTASAARKLAAMLVVLAVGVAGARAGTELGSMAWVPTSEHPVGWRGDGTGRYVGAEPPVMWERTGGAMKGILWAAPMANHSVATPIIVGDKIFVTSEPGDLVCIDKKSGRTLWIASSSSR